MIHDANDQAVGRRTSNMRFPERVRWRIGWHPRYVLAAGAVLGFVVGNVVVTWGVRAAMLRGGLWGIAAPVRAVFGTGGLYLMAMATIPVVVSMAVGGLVGTLVWLLGRRAVSATATAVLDTLLAELPAAPYRYVVGDTPGPFGASPRTYRVTRFDPGESALAVTVDRVAMPARTVEREWSATVAYDRIEGLDYDADRSVLRLRTAAGRAAVPTGERPTDLLAALADRAPDVEGVADTRTDLTGTREGDV